MDGSQRSVASNHNTGAGHLEFRMRTRHTGRGNDWEGAVDSFPLREIKTTLESEYISKC